ncbi:MAG: DUF6599 family protein [Planctomycetota bacterium]|jgi:hypothetical protein
MDNLDHKEKGLESVLSIIILLILFGIGAWVFSKQFDTDISRFGIHLPIQNQQSDNKETAEEKIDLTSFAPDEFETLPKTDIYTAKNLYEKINGKAPLYTESGFEKLMTQRFANKQDENLWMELYVYDMANMKNAFSVYSIQKRPDAHTDLSLGADCHYKTSNGFYLVCDKYYIELTGSSESEKLNEAIKQTALKINKKLSTRDIHFSEFDLLPKDNLIKGSFKLYLANAFGFEGLTNTFTAKYNIEGGNITAFISKKANNSKAQENAENYRKFLTENGATNKKSLNNTLEGKVLDFYGTIEIVFEKGAVVAGIHEADSQQPAENLALQIFNKLEKQ